MPLGADWLENSDDFLQFGEIEEMLKTLRESLEDVLFNSHVLVNARKNLSAADDNDLSWRLEIPRDKPLRFNQSENQRGSKFIPELNCIIEGGTRKERPIESIQLELKLCSSKPDFIFREAWDSKRVAEKIEESKSKERVMIRFHFDSGKKTEDGEPLFHFNLGGVAAESELCWMPTTIRNPRFSYMPLDLVLACELVVSNFFPKKYRDLQDNPDWRALVYRSEYVLLRPIVVQNARRCNTDVLRRRETRDDTLLWSGWLVGEDS